ncbi:hypothetical protein M5689_019148 [Euphorbia peplus]|nr:hypothetical protein M5689_019148 [Euphorbia peplus]
MEGRGEQRWSGGGLNGDGGRPKTWITSLFHCPESHRSIQRSIRPKLKSTEIGGDRRDFPIVVKRFGQVTGTVDGLIRFFDGREEKAWRER